MILKTLVEFSFVHFFFGQSFSSKRIWQIFINKAFAHDSLSWKFSLFGKYCDNFQTKNLSVRVLISAWTNVQILTRSLFSVQSFIFWWRRKQVKKFLILHAQIIFIKAQMDKLHIVWIPKDIFEKESSVKFPWDIKSFKCKKKNKKIISRNIKNDKCETYKKVLPLPKSVKSVNMKF